MNQRQRLIGAGTPAALGGGAIWLKMLGMGPGEGSSSDHPAKITPIGAAFANLECQLDHARLT